MRAFTWAGRKVRASKSSWPSNKCKQSSQQQPVTKITIIFFQFWNQLKTGCKLRSQEHLGGWVFWSSSFINSNVSKPLQLLFRGIQGLTQNFHFRPFLWAVLTMHAKVKLCGKHWPQNILKGRNIHEPAITIQWVSYKSVNGCLNYCTWTSQQVMHGQWNSNTALKNKKDKQKNLRSSTHRIYIG